MIKNKVAHLNIIFVFFFAFVLVGCGGGDDGSETVFISGIASDEPVSKGIIKVQSFTGVVLASGTTDESGRFSIEVEERGIQEGYELVVTGGQIGNVEFTGELRALYSFSEDRGAANVTLMTTLVSRLVDEESAGSSLEKRDTVIQRLASIGVVESREWNDVEPASFSLSNLRHSITVQGFETVMTALTRDLHDGDVSTESMDYFPNAHGGIVDASFGIKNSVSTVLGEARRDLVRTYSIDPSAHYTYRIISGPEWVSIDGNGILSLAVPIGGVEGTILPISIRVTNSVTGFWRDIDGQVFLMAEEVVASGSVDAQGGTIQNDAGDIAVEVGQGAVTGTAQINVSQGADSEGNVVLNIAHQGSIDGEYKVYLPDPDVLMENSANVPVTLRSLPTTIDVIGKTTVPSIDGRYKCQEGEDNHIIMDHCWWTNPEYFLDDGNIADTGAAGEALRIPSGNQMKVDTDPSSPKSFSVRVLLASQLWSSLPENPDALFGKEAVLFIHGFTPFNELGGGEDTYGNFQQLVFDLNSSGTYVPFEFQWRSSARFQDVADDLYVAIEKINEATGKKIHIIAHSFGGILTRTLLQGLSTSFRDASAMIATVTTLGTPHSGIADSIQSVGQYETQLPNGTQWTTLGTYVPKGQDSILFEGCTQISCYQMGEDVNYSDRAISILKLQVSKGYVASRLADLASRIPQDISFQALIGLTSLYSSRLNSHYASTGDRLISYEGQRFHPKLTLNTAFDGLDIKPLLDGSGLIERGNMLVGGGVVEKLLGYSVDYIPGETINSENKLSKSYPWGYAHTGRTGEANVLCPENTGCEHDGWIKTRDFLVGKGATAVAKPYFTVSASIQDDAGNPIQGARISLTSNNTEVYSKGNHFSDKDGIISVELPFSPYTTYTPKVFPPSGSEYQAMQSPGTLTTGSVQDSSGNVFPTITLNRVSTTARYGTMSGYIKEALTGTLLANAKYSIINSVGRVVTNDTTVDGEFSEAGLLPGMYRVEASMDGYLSSKESCYVSVDANNSCELGLTKLEVIIPEPELLFMSESLPDGCSSYNQTDCGYEITEGLGVVKTWTFKNSGNVEFGDLSLLLIDDNKGDIVVGPLIMNKSVVGTGEEFVLKANMLISSSVVDGQYSARWKFVDPAGNEIPFSNGNAATAFFRFNINRSMGVDSGTNVGSYLFNGISQTASDGHLNIDGIGNLQLNVKTESGTNEIQFNTSYKCKADFDADFVAGELMISDFIDTGFSLEFSQNSDGSYNIQSIGTSINANNFNGTVTDLSLSSVRFDDHHGFGVCAEEPTNSAVNTSQILTGGIYESYSNGGNQIEYSRYSVDISEAIFHGEAHIYDSETAGFVSAESVGVPLAVLKEDGQWVSSVDDSTYHAKLNQDGTLSLSVDDSATTPSFSISLDVSDIAGLKQIEGLDSNWQQAIVDPDRLFSEGAEFYRLSQSFSHDYVELEGCEDTNNCDVILTTSGTPLTSLNQLVSSNAWGGSGSIKAFGYPGDGGAVVELVQGGEANYYVNESKVASSTFTYKTVGATQLLISSVPDSVHDYYPGDLHPANIFFVEKDGYVFSGNYYQAGEVAGPFDFGYNGIAFNDILGNFVGPGSSTEGSMLPPTAEYRSSALVSPNGGEIWYSGTLQTINWNAQQLAGDTVDLWVLNDDPSDLSNDTIANYQDVVDGKNWSKFASAVLNNGSYTLDPSDLNGNGNAYMVLIKSSSGGWDISDTTFTLAGDSSPSNQLAPVSGPVVTELSSYSASVGIYVDITIYGSDLPADIVVNIEGAATHCSYVSGAGDSVTVRCLAEVSGQKRFYIAKESGGEAITGSENLFLTVSDSEASANDNPPEVTINTVETKQSGNFILSVTVTDDVNLKGVGYWLYPSNEFSSSIESGAGLYSGNQATVAFTIHAEHIQEGTYKIKVIATDANNQPSVTKWYWFDKI